MNKSFRVSIALLSASFLSAGALVSDALGNEEAKQVIEGEIVLPSGTLFTGGASRPYYRQCTHWYLGQEAAKGAQDALNDVFGHIFEVDPETRGHPFDLQVMTGTDANLDILFWSPVTGVATIRVGGERGIVPRSAEEGYICLAEGSRVSFRYEAGPSVPAPSLSYETDIAAHSDNLALVGRASSELSPRRLVFQGRYAFASSANGVEIFRLVPRFPYIKQVAYLTCSGNPVSADISVWGDYLFYSVPNEYPYFATNPRDEYNDDESDACNNTDESSGKAGIRIFDISDPRAPHQVKFIETPCGTMNHTLVPHRGDLYIYAPIPCDDDGRVDTPAIGAPGETPLIPSKEFRPLNMQISIFRINPRDPNDWEHVGTPTLSDDLGQRQLGCHDVTVLPSRGLAACPQFFNDATHTSLLDISDPTNPRVISNLPMPSESVWMAHAAFTWDGKYLVLADADRAGYSIDKFTPCTGRDEETLGALWIYDITDPATPHRVSQFMLPRSSAVPDEPCSPWEINMIPTIDQDRRVAVVGWMAGGMTLVDLTDAEQPQELGHWQPAPASQTAGSYFYNGKIYSLEYWTPTGIRVFELDGFDEKTTRSYRVRMNPQTQLPEFRN